MLCTAFTAGLPPRLQQEALLLLQAQLDLDIAGCFYGVPGVSLEILAESHLGANAGQGAQRLGCVGVWHVPQPQQPRSAAFRLC